MKLSNQLNNATVEQLSEWQAELTSDYKAIQAQQLNLDLTRGKPSAEQLSLSDSIDGILNGKYASIDGTDTRNYGGLTGIKEARALGASLMSLPASQVMAGGNSSLTLMYQVMMTALHFGLSGPDSAWKHNKKNTIICPVPGYDRHFSVCEHLGIDMITVAMTSEGPDMDAVEALIKRDDSIRGMWCVPRFSNPTGVVYSDEVVDRIAALATLAHKDFRIFWDNAYAVHALSPDAPELANLYDACVAKGTSDSVLHFASTSKITHAGAGVAFYGSSDTNLSHFQHALSFMSIGPDKINQLRHAHFFASEGSLQTHMEKHAAIIQPRFQVVLRHLSDAFSSNGLGRWESAQGGYFISFDTLPGLAKRVVKLAADAGVKLTPAGATFPYGNDPEDSNIRIAPTVPTVDQVDKAMNVFVTCVNLASVEQALSVSPS